MKWERKEEYIAEDHCADLLVGTEVVSAQTMPAWISKF